MGLSARQTWSSPPRTTPTVETTLLDDMVIIERCFSEMEMLVSDATGNRRSGFFRVAMIVGKGVVVAVGRAVSAHNGYGTKYWHWLVWSMGHTGHKVGSPPQVFIAMTTSRLRFPGPSSSGQLRPICGTGSGSVCRPVSSPPARVETRRANAVSGNPMSTTRNLDRVGARPHGTHLVLTCLNHV